MTKKINFSKASTSFLGAGLIALTVIVAGTATYASADTLYRQLEVGSTGADVSSLQTFLAQDPTLYPQGLVTSYFGSLTKTAVANFQSRNGLDPVGRVGPLTLPVINAQMNSGINSGSSASAPVISNLSIAVSNTTAAFNWNTSQGAAAIVYYSTSPLSMIESGPGTGVTISGSSALINTNLTSTHVGTLTGLQPNTTYYYTVYVRNGSGSENITWPSTFHTNQ